MRGEEGDKEDLTVTRTILAMMDNIDMNVGRVLKKLDDLKLSDNTIVVYFSDNGPNSSRWNGGMKGKKGVTDEGGVRSALFMRWPGKIKEGALITPIAGAIDLLPTLTALAGVIPGAALAASGVAEASAAGAAAGASSAKAARGLANAKVAAPSAMRKKRVAVMFIVGPFASTGPRRDPRAEPQEMIPPILKRKRPGGTSAPDRPTQPEGERC
jgi:arylsulfatase A-like enzyme